MEKNEIKKLLYKENPVAKLQGIRKGLATYIATVTLDTEPVKTSKNIYFEIPVNDMGMGDFDLEMDSKFLIRWLADEYTPS